MEVTAEEECKKTQERQREMQRRMNPTTVEDFEVGKADGCLFELGTVDCGRALAGEQEMLMFSRVSDHGCHD